MSRAKKIMKSRWLWAGFSLAAVSGVAVCGASWWAVAQSQQVPDFYKRARSQSQANVEIARNQFQHDVEQVRKQSLRGGFWKASFGEDEINAWVQSEFPERFERLLAHGVTEPAIAIENGELFAAARYVSSGWDTVISCRLSVEMTEEPNLLAIALSDLKAGALPLPLEPFVRKISKEAAIGDLDIRWDFTQDGPIALVKIPQEDPRFVIKPLVIESINLIAGQLQLDGRGGQDAANEYQPRGPLHRFVSYRTREIQ
ncbi:hypothetical protein [Allorhodopirellula heiligendammensis]|uniref:Uncharacterized protein n=1 Tax=Allorhodopirellula heiligendammensis TaxID=2714739 RepID=A0A5C6BZ40_9BACT|nr:hypothetical protein [Allorhodopirellula heiligendammensis]TWU15859.1 hypothetical protein Poly21_30610 [Allorhodopirellula heiligendammensis]|tara:strand:+ start:930 stop:1700 length:771 start_codon:yes stop_codon:yes gene_type:complete